MAFGYWAVGLMAQCLVRSLHSKLLRVCEQHSPSKADVASQEPCSPTRMSGAMLTPIVLRPTGAHRSRAIAILPDMLGAEDLRKLRVLLRLGRSPEHGAESATRAAATLGRR
jgi:hypothetical protein